MNTKPGAWMLIYCKNKKSFLFSKRGPQMHKPNLWNLFGGHLDEGETASVGVLREIQEEAAILPEDKRIIRLSPDGYRPLGRVCGIRDMHYFLMVTSEEISPSLDHEHSAFGWYKYDALPHRVNRPTAIALNIGLFVKAVALVEDDSIEADMPVRPVC